MTTNGRIEFEKAKVKMDEGREMSLVYGIPQPLPTDPTCLVIAHGAGGPMFSPFITYFHVELAKRGFLTVKFNFPYMEARKKFPDKSDVLKASYAKIVEEVRATHRPKKIFIGGKSMGGRIASMIAADGADVNGLFFFGYPLHPPGRREKLRDEHLYRITKPMLFVSGTKDAFATRELLGAVITKLGMRARAHWIEGGDHSFNTEEGKAGQAKTYEDVILTLVDWAGPPNRLVNGRVL